MQVKDRPVETSDRAASAMVHIALPPYTRGICGAVLGGEFTDGGQLDCVVCAEFVGEA